MATTYAHWYFGGLCLETLPKNLQKVVNQHREIYDLAVHGPDIFFYDLPHSKVMKYGYQLHNIPVSVFLTNAKEVYDQNGCKDEMMAYLLGFLTHFTLDSSVHSYVEAKRETCNISHNEVESQWDRHIMLVDGRQPNLVDRSESLKPNMKIASVISLFYQYNSYAVYRTLKWQVAIIRLTNAISIKKQEFLQKLCHKLHADNYADLFIDFNEHEICKDSNIRLDKLMDNALKLYPKLVNNFIKFLNDEQDLQKYFDHDLEAWPDYKKTKVLSYDDELNYRID